MQLLLSLRCWSFFFAATHKQTSPDTHTHTRRRAGTVDALGLFICMRACICEVQLRRSSSRSLSLSVARLFYPRACYLFTFNFFLRKRSGASTSSAAFRCFLLLFCMHTDTDTDARTYTHTNTVTHICTRTAAAAQCTWLFCGTFAFRHVPFCKLPTTFFFAYSFLRAGN